MRKTTILVLVLSVSSFLLAQRLDNHATAGYDSSRTYANHHQGNIQAPLRMEQSIDLPGVVNAGSLLVFEDSSGLNFLVAEEGTGSVDYRLFDGSSGALQWTVSLAGSVAGEFNYQPSYDNDLVLLGGAATSAVSAVRVSTGATVWSDNGVGGTTGRYPVLTDGLALYHGSTRVRAVNPTLGPSDTFWQISTTTAEAPISVHNQRAYVLTGSSLRALDVATGIEAWSLGGIATTNPNIIATEDLVFINGTVAGILGAFSAADGSGIWGQSTPGILSDSPSMALAGNHLVVFTDETDNGNAAVFAVDPATGSTIWSATDEGPGIDYGLVMNNTIYYYHQATQAIRGRNLFTGTLVDDIPLADVRALCAAQGNLYVLLANQVQVLSTSNQFFFAQVADGAGQRLLASLVNNGSSTATGSISFFQSDGSPFVVEVDGSGSDSTFNFVIPPGGTLALQTLGTTPFSGRGWARVNSDQPLTGTSIFQFLANDVIEYEAGVAGVKPTGTTLSFAQLMPDPGNVINTGVAVANPGGSSASVTYVLLDDTGNAVATTSTMLAPGNHEAQFLNQLFPVETAFGFSGGLRIESNVPVVVTSLRTLNGLQLSSIPVAQ